MRKPFLKQSDEIAKPPPVEVVDGEQRHCEEPAGDFLTHLQVDAASACYPLATRSALFVAECLNRVEQSRFARWVDAEGDTDEGAKAES